MIFQDFYNLSIYRQDGRKQQQLRQFVCQLGLSENIENITNIEIKNQSFLEVVQQQYDGSSYVKMGLTEVLCFIKGPKPQLNQKDDSIIQINYIQAPFSGVNRKEHKKFNKEWNEFSESLRISFEELIVSEHYLKSRIEILITVLQNDGSTKSAVFNAISLALLDSGIEIKDIQVSCTVGLFNNEVLSDLTYNEEKDCQAQLTISYLAQQHLLDYIELKNSKIFINNYQQMQQQAIQTCIHIYNIIRQNVLNYAIKKHLFSLQEC